MTTDLAPSTLGDTALDAALGRAAEVASAETARARVFLRAALRRTASSAVGAAAWRASALTPAGHPVELAVASTSAALRTVAAVLPPESDPATGLAEALRLAGELGGHLDPAVHARLRRLQQPGGLRWGAFLGARHADTGTGLKLYAEVPRVAGTPAWVLLDEIVPGLRDILGGTGRLHMVGVSVGGVDDAEPVVEVYVRCRALDELGVRSLCGRAGFGRAGRRLVRHVEAARSRRGPALGGPSLGASVSGSRAAGVVALAVFAHAAHLHRDDRGSRAALLARARGEQWPCTALYDALSAPLADAPDPTGRRRRPVHAAVSFVLAGPEGRSGDRIDHHVGMAPPPLDARPRLSTTGWPDTTPAPRRPHHEADHAPEPALR